MSNFEGAIQVARQAVDATPEDHPERSARLNDLGNCLGSRYSRTGAIADLEEAIQIARQAVDATPQHHRDRAARLNNLALHLGRRYSRTGAMADLEGAIQIARRAVDATPEDHPNRAARLNNLGNRLGGRYSRTGAIADLEEAIQIARQAVAATPEDHPNHAGWLNNLGNRLGDRYSRTGAMADLEEAIQIARQAVNATPEDHPDYATCLNNLGNNLGDRYSRTGAIVDLEEAIQIARQSVDATAEGHPNHARWLNNLGLHLGDRYSRTGAMADLEEAIQIARQAVAATPEDHPDQTACLNNLVVCLGDRYSRTGAMADLEEAIQVARQAVAATPEDHPDRAEQLNNLGNRLGDRYSRTGAMADLEEAIQIARQAVDATAEDHPSRAAWLNNLGVHLGGNRYSRTGAMADLEEAIQIARQSVDTTPEDHPDRAARLNNLGNRLGGRYSRTGAMADLEEAIQIARQAVDATAEDHPERASRLNNLGNRLGGRYSRTGAIADLEEAIQIARQAVAATPEDHPDRTACLNNLIVRLGDRYSRTGAMADLEEAIQVARQAVDATAEDHPDYARWLNNLGVCFGIRYSRTGAIDDLEKAIQIARQAVAATPQDHPDRAERLNNLGNRLGNKYSKTGAMADLEESTVCYESALQFTEASIDTRMAAGILLFQSCAQVSDWERGSKYSAMAVELAPQLIARSLKNADKQYRLSQIAGLACDASAASLNAGRVLLLALNLLEQGRGVLAASLHEMRTDVLDLQAKHPELAERFVRLRNELQPPVTEPMLSLEQSRMPFLKTQADRRHFAGSELDRLIAEIQQQSGFEDFLRPPSEGEILDAGQHGPIVVINVSEYRCDAFLIDQHRIQTVPLPNFTYQGIKEKVQQGSLGTPQVLEWLWDVVAHPVLDALGFTEPPPDEKWPHVWWIPTGPLSKFPLHAAGYHGKGSNHTVLDRVMSSYSSSIKAIIHGRRRRNLQDASKTPNRALLVALEVTPNQTRLHFAAREVQILYNLCESSDLHPVQHRPRKEDVVSQLPSCKIFHFAGHGYTNNKDPSQSSLLLEDWESDPLTVADLLEMNLRERAPFLAYLSACGTGEIGDERFLDESIHLISACQLAGFRHVIGTLWEVHDEICMDMTRITYEQIRDGGMTDESVCLGLHKATKELRDRWFAKVVSRGRELGNSAHETAVEHEMEAITLDGTGSVSTRLPRKAALLREAPLHWVPYVHFGV
ncbi:hypothetical protein BU25DRAFT_268013 [Macroventuria anomochaeta]|uniref:Uncharacterized protein n=1 Tax=Macroventuria anomochaeta TaxID=301207 RepID=A0ACB6S5F6_9PLEO|nr:uncharacterized protein BU25DRAFT_268013 [Macroventuria anomochaeta]KAF2629495.1 hypothetical protein BU25DRAFT_268013 [Macroventuria anomochaeta]